MVEKKIEYILKEMLPEKFGVKVTENDQRDTFILRVGITITTQYIG